MIHQLELTDLRRDWVEDAVAVILRASTATLPDLFTADDLHGILQPPSNKNWFGIALAKLSNTGKVEKAGYQPSKRPEANGRIVAVWRRLQ